MLTISKQMNNKHLIECTMFSNKHQKIERVYSISNINLERVDIFLRKTGYEDDDIQHALWTLKNTSLPVKFDESGKLVGVISQ